MSSFLSCMGLWKCHSKCTECYHNQWLRNFCFRKSIDGLAHVWRVIAYYMGVDDDSNLVKKNLQQTKELLLDVGYRIVMPALLQMDSASIIMAKNVTNAFHFDFHVCIYATCEGYGFELQDLWQEFSWLQRLKYYWSKLLLEHLYYIPWFRRLWNRLAAFLIGLNGKKVSFQKSTSDKLNPKLWYSENAAVVHKRMKFH